MPYTVVNDNTHMCELPVPGLFLSGAQIQCDECHRLYWRSEKFWTKKPYWSDDFSW